MERTLWTASHSVVSLDDGRMPRDDSRVIRRDDLRSRLIRVLHVTNGDSTVETMRRAHIVGDIVAWRDVLHEGPVPALTAAELRPCARSSSRRWRRGRGGRSRPTCAPATSGWARRSTAGERVVLWFEHDLYDQLQLLQILAGLPDRPVGVELICVGSFPGRPGFAGLGELEPDELASLWPLRAPVVDEHVRAARAAWDVFRAPDPRGLAACGRPPDERLPFVAAGAAAAARGAARRRATASPARSASCWRAVAAGARTREQAFLAAAASEEAPFLGDDDRVRAPRGARLAGRTRCVTADELRAHRRRRRRARRPRRPRGAQRLRPLARRRAPARGRRAAGAGTRSGACSSSPDALASKACPTPLPFAPRSPRRSPTGPSPSRSGTAPRSPRPGPTDPPSPPARRRRSRHVLRAPGQLGLGRAYVSGALDVDDLDAVDRACSTTGSRRDRPPAQGAPDASPRRAPPASCARRRRPRPS